MNIKDSYIHNGTAVLKDVKVENSVLKKILAGKDANDAYLGWETVCDLTGIKPKAAGTADKVGHKLTFSGGVTGDWDGSADKTVAIPTKSSWNYDDIYLKLSGGTITGPIKFSNSANSNLSNNYLSAGGGYSSNSGRLGLKLVSIDQSDIQAGIGVDLTGFTYETTISTGRKNDTIPSYITFATHNSESSSYKRLGYFKASGDTDPFVLFHVGGTVEASKFIGSLQGNASTATNADTLDGVHYQNILERQNSGYSESGTATGWFRIAETLTADGDGITFLLAIQRNYNYTNNESYLFSISISYNGGISITQLSGYANSRLITKIRVDWSNSQIAYIDLYINASYTNNSYYWYTVGCAKSYTAWTANPTLVGNAYEFTTVQGCKSDRGFTGDLTGNASSATNADTLDGYHAQVGHNKPWGTIPVITEFGWMDVGKQFEFHYDNTTGSDYSTILRCTGNYSNIIDLPSTSGTLALTTDNVASASKWAIPRTITLTGSVTGSVSIDGSQNVSLATTTNHTHNYAGSSSAGGSANSALTLLYSNKFDTNYGDYAVFQQDYGRSDFPHSGWFNSIKMLHNNSNGYFTEIATSFTGEDGMWRRALQGGSQAGWYKILDSGNFNSYALPISGGTLTGSVTMSGMDTNLIRNIVYGGTSGWSRNLITLQVDGVDKFAVGAYGNYTAGASSNGIYYGYIGCNSYDGLNLRISATSLSWGDNSILHAGNYNSYSPKLDGTGATGTWGISITGNAKTATTSTYASNVGSSGTAGTNYVTAANVISMYNWYNSITATDEASNTAIDKWNEIVSFLTGITDTSTLSGILAGYAAAGHNHDGRYIKWGGSAADTNAMAWGTLTAANGYTILSHAASSDGGDWGMVNKDGKIYMQLDGYYYQNEGQYRVTDVSETVTALGTNGDYLTWTKNGTINNITVPYAAASTKLQTSRTLWGRPFDGTDNVNGHITMDGEYSLKAYMPRKKANGGGWAYSPLIVLDASTNDFAHLGIYGSNNTLDYIYIGSNEYYSTQNLLIYPTGNVEAVRFISNISTGTSPLAITSTTLCTNLNADMLDGYHETSFCRYRGSYGKSYTAASIEYNLDSGTYITEEQGYSGTLLSFNSSGSASSIQFWTHYSQGYLYYRTSIDSNRWGKTDGFWTRILDSDSYTEYTVKKDGTGASGTWEISITGNAATATSASNADTLNNIDSTGFLRQVVVPNNAENDFNTFSNMTLTGRVDPTTGALLKNAPWTGRGPAGGYGVLTYLFDKHSASYGTQIAVGYNSNKIYIRNRYWGDSGVVWGTTWDSLALTSEVTNLLSNYLPLSGGTMSNTNVVTNLNADLLDGKHATNFLAWTSMQNIGSSSPFQDAVNFFNNLDNLNNGGKLVYNHAGAEYTELFTRRNDSTAHGTIIKWGYTDNYIRIIRMIFGKAQSTDWEKISAGYADTAGSVDWNNVSNKPTTINGYGITDALTTKSVIWKNDYERYVILLCKIGTNSTNEPHTINGTFWTTSGGVSRYQAAYINVHCSDWTSGHNGYYGFTPFGLGTKCRLVTCTYQSSQYLAITFENIMATSIYFDGSYDNILFTPVLYYLDNTNTIKNSEIYNSISEVIYKKLDIYEIPESTASYSLSNAAWTNTITLPTTAGSYVLNIVSGNSTLTGVFSIGASDNAKDEISLHLHGNGPRLYARTNGTTLQLSSNDASATSHSVTIKYRRMI